MEFGHRVHARCACGSSLSSSAAFEAAAAAGRPSGAKPFVFDGTERVFERPRPFRIEHIALDLTLDHDARSVDGTAQLELSRVDRDAAEVVLDAVGFQIVHVKWRARAGSRSKGAWRRARHVYDGEKLFVSVSPKHAELSLSIRYRTAPRRGMYFLAPDDQVPDRPNQIWTQCQDEDARHIFPCHDKPHIKQTMDIAVRTRPGWFVLSNGDLTNGKRAQRSGVFRYAMKKRLPTYLFTIVAGEFSRLKGEGGPAGLPITYYVPAGREDDGARTFANTPAMIDLFSRLTGVSYPWSKYAQVVVSDFIFGGMENTGATTMYEHILVDERASLDVSSDDLIAHELGHQWFGDLVTCRDWSHGWLNEGFATYLEHVWREHHLGKDEYQQGIRYDLNSYLAEAERRYQRPVVCQDYEAPIDIFDRHLYEKGGLTLHALRMELGDDAFWGGVRLYLERHAGGVVETRDLMRALEEHSGRSLEQFFQQNVFRAGHARLDVRVGYSKGILTVDVKQRLDGDAAPFAVPLELEIGAVKGAPKRVVRRVTKKQETFAIPLERRPLYVVVDPNQRIVGRVTSSAPADMLRQQLGGASTARGRTLAAIALGKIDDLASQRALVEALTHGRGFWGTRAAAAASLGRHRSPGAKDALLAALRTRHPKVRRAVARALGEFRDPEVTAALARLVKRERSVLVMSSAARSLGATRQPGAYEPLVELLDQPSWANVIASGAVAGLAQLRDPRAEDVLRERTAYGHDNRVRRASLNALATLAPNRRTRELLEDMLSQSDPHLRVTVADALAELGDVEARPALLTQLERDLDGRVRRRIRETLRDLGATGQNETRRLREEMETLRRQHVALKARMAKLEARLDGKAKAPAKAKV